MSSFRPHFRTFAVALALWVCAGSAFAFWGPKKHKRDVRAEVTLVDQQWRAAQLASDIPALEKLLSDDYLGITGSGTMLTKQQQLDRVRSRQLQFERLEITDLKVRVASPSTAILTSSADLDGTVEGRKVHGMFRSMRVYQRQPNGTWKMTNFEATPMRNHDRPDPQS